MSVPWNERREIDAQRAPRPTVARARAASSALLVACVAVVLAVDARAEGPDGGAKGPDLSDSATCEPCHKAIVERKEEERHGALASGCDTCHKPSDKPGKCKLPAVKGWALASEEPKLCLDCHDVTDKTALHPVITSSGCTACHDPHGSQYPKLLAKATVVEVCQDCHPAPEGKSVHTAVKKGRCLGCHSPHAGKEAPLLIAPRATLCLSCHKLEVIAKDHVKHVPVLEGRCLECHEPHASYAAPKQLRADGAKLCLICHDVKARAGLDRPGPSKRVDLSKKDVHNPVENGDCQDCHVRGHGGPNRKLLQKPPPELCYGCHDRLDTTPYVHGAVRLGDCTGCHFPHSGDNPTLLRAATIKDLCLGCHSDDITGRAFVHKPVAEGKCTECHDQHGSDFPFNLKKGEGKVVCYACHKPMDTGKNKHAALERYGCTVCHDPHGTANRFQLLQPVNELCQSCHVDKKDGYHVTNLLSSGHKITGGPDPHNLDRDFSCASCHNPHGSDSAKLLRFGDTTVELCDWCHGDRTGKHPELKDITKRRRPAPSPASPPPKANGSK